MYCGIFALWSCPLIKKYLIGNVPKNKITSSLYLVSIGTKKPDPFDKFVSSWWSAVEKMNPLPDEIIICASEGNTCKILDIPRFAKNRTTIIYINSNAPMSSHLNAAVENCNGKWISWIGIDDLPLEGLFSSITGAEKKKCEIILSGIKTSSGKTIFSNWDRLVPSNNNTVMGNTVCTKDLWKRAGGYPNIYFNDWGFWLRCYSLKPKIHETRDLTMLFSDSEDYARRSGLKNYKEFERAFTEITKIKSELRLKVNLKTKIVISVEKLVNKTKIIVRKFAIKFLFPDDFYS
jgi:hypothetical protein